jgi:hypothetical protein
MRTVGQIGRLFGTAARGPAAKYGLTGSDRGGNGVRVRKPSEPSNRPTDRPTGTDEVSK